MKSINVEATQTFTASCGLHRYPSTQPPSLVAACGMHMAALSGGHLTWMIGADRNTAAASVRRKQRQTSYALELALATSRYNMTEKYMDVQMSV